MKVSQKPKVLTHNIGCQSHLSTIGYLVLFMTKQNIIHSETLKSKRIEIITSESRNHNVQPLGRTIFVGQTKNSISNGF